jgi:hypothetical protein
MQTNQRLESILARLVNEELLDASKRDEIVKESRASVPKQDDSPWYVKGLMGLGAWFAALFFTVFLGIAGFFKGLPLVFAIFLGGSVCGGAAFAMRKSHNIFVTQFALAASLVGQLLLILGFARKGSIDTILMVAICVQVVLFFVNNSMTHRFLCSVFASSALFVLIQKNVPGLFHLLVLGHAVACAFVWLQDKQWKFPFDEASFLRPLGYGVAVSLLGALVLSAMPDMSFKLHVGSWIVSAAGIAVVWLIVSLLLFREVGEWTSETIAVALGLGLFAASAYNAPGVLASGLVMTLAFARKERVLLVLSIVALAGFLFFFYYNIKIDLLTKSIALFVPGSILLGLRVFLRRGASEKAEVTHA